MAYDVTGVAYISLSVLFVALINGSSKFYLMQS